MNRHKLVNFVSVAAITIAAVIMALIGHGDLRKIFAMPLVFILPGYAMLSAWYPKRLIKFPGNILLIVALSLCITSLSGIVLNGTPWGITTASLALGLGGFTLINLILAFFGRGQFTVGSRRKPGDTIPATQMAMIIAAFGVSVFALYLGRQGALHQNAPSFTQMWMLPGESDHAVNMGVTNREHGPVDYKLLIKDGTTVIEVSFELEPDETWEDSFTLPEGAYREVNAYLSRSDKPRLVYRTTSIWLPHTE